MPVSNREKCYSAEVEAERARIGQFQDFAERAADDWWERYEQQHGAPEWSQYLEVRDGLVKGQAWGFRRGHLLGIARGLGTVGRSNIDAELDRCAGIPEFAPVRAEQPRLP